MNNFYVYEHLRADNGSCFYVGKGCHDRAEFKPRNPKHDEMVDKYGMVVNIIADNLSEDDAFDLERYTIMDYIINKGYSIDIEGYRNNSENILTNLCFGGKGSYGSVHSDDWCDQHSMDMSGINNIFWNRNMWEELSEEEKEIRRKKMSELHSGEKNSMYGVSPQERMSPKTYEQWLNKLTTRLHSQTGENNPNYGNDTLKKKLEENPELKIEYYSRPGSQNGRARNIDMYDLEMNHLKSFEYIGACAEYLKESLGLKSKINSIRGSIIESIKKGKPYRNYYFK